MKRISENIRAMAAGYGHYKVEDLANGITLTIPAWIVDDCDEDDQQSVETCLARLRAEFAKKDEPRYNIIIDVTDDRTAYWTGDGYQCDGLLYRDAWEPEQLEQELAAARQKYLNATFEEVEPFEF